MLPLSFRPKWIEALQGYNRGRWIADTFAGLTVSVVALPLAMAFAIASGLTPQAGLASAVVGGFLVSALGGSRVQIGGPAGAFIVVVYSIVQAHGVQGLLLATLMSGVWMMLMGVLRMGVLVRFIPVAVITGFTNGIAVLIALTQCKDFLGLSLPHVPADAIGLVQVLIAHLAQTNPLSLALNLSCLGLLVFWQAGPKLGLPEPAHALFRLMPGPLFVLVFASVCVSWGHLPVPTLGDRFGQLPSDLWSMRAISFQLSDLQAVWRPSLTLAMLGAIESLLCARVADNMANDRHDPNQELMAQGIANAVMPFVGGMPVTGTIARTMTNVHHGASSPVAGMTHALGLWLIVWMAAPLVQWVPLGALSAILLFVAWNMGEWHTFKTLNAFRWPYRWTFLAVFALTVLADLTVAIEVGLAAACLTFIYRISSLSQCQLVHDDGDTQAWALTGALFFGAVDRLSALTTQLPRKTLTLNLQAVIYIDSSGAQALKELLHRCQQHHVRLCVRGLNAQPKDILTRVGLLPFIQTHEDDGFTHRQT